MTKRVQLLGHDAVTANAFIGFDRELTVDTENEHLRLHDGDTPGGWFILNRDENDNRYQARSVELDGLLGWEPNERGILARQGPSNYDLITITVDPNNMTIEFGDAYTANPFIALAPNIESPHVWNNQHQFNDVVEFTAGINADLFGDTTGLHTGNVVGNVTGNLTGNADGDHTGTFTGEGVFTAITVPVGSIPLEALDSDALDSIALGATFIGMITPYSGDTGDLPANWVVCDGTNGTPDLRDRFILGAGPTYPVDSTGGAATHSHTVTIDSGGAHTHTGTIGGHSLTIAELAAHTHYSGVTDNTGSDVFSRGSAAAASTTPNSIESNSADGTFEGLSSTTGSGDPHSHSLTVDSGGAHSHTGSTAAGSSLPPYYSLVYVMRIL